MALVTAEQVIEKNLEEILRLALLAPSVHNTQPWKIRLEHDTFIVSLDPQYLLSDGDPTGRQTIISLGIFAESIAISAGQFGLQKKSIRYQNKEALISLKVSKKVQAPSEIEALKQRVTDRSIYSLIDIKASEKTKITRCARDIKARIWVTNNQKHIQEVAELTGKGIGVALSNPHFRKELSQYLVTPWSKKKRGISTSSLYIPKLLSFAEPLLMRAGLGINAEVALEKRRWMSASAIIFITTEGDMPAYWFEAGRAYIHAALTIEKLGYSQATSAATVEASNYHEDVEELLGTTERLQSVIRIGRGARVRNHSPRVDTKAITT